MEKRNEDIRARAKACGVPLWKIAEGLGIAEPTIIRRLRQELLDTEKERIYSIILRRAARPGYTGDDHNLPVQ